MTRPQLEAWIFSQKGALAGLALLFVGNYAFEAAFHDTYWRLRHYAITAAMWAFIGFIALPVLGLVGWALAAAVKALRR